MDMNQYLEIFIEESKEHLQTVNDKLLELEKSPTNLTIVQEIFRSAHTLKGMSATMGFDDLAHLTHSMENVLDDIRNEKRQVTSQIMDVLFQGVEMLEVIIFNIANGGDGKQNVSKIVSKIEAVSNDKETMSTNTIEKETFVCTIELSKTVVLKAARAIVVIEKCKEMGEVIETSPSLEDIGREQFHHEFTVTLNTILQPEEVIAMLQHLNDVIEVRVLPIADETTMSATPSPQEEKQEEQTEKAVGGTEKPVTAPQSRSIRVNIDRLDGLMNLFEELVIDRGRLEQIAHEINHTELTETVERMSRISTDLQSIILKMRMVPVDTVFNRFPRMVRQLTKELGKQVNFVVAGQDTELDRTVIDEIGDPLVHLIRNAIDHGIESPSDRIANGKAGTGTLHLHAYHSGNHVFIEIKDDGKGIHPDVILNKAIRKGLVTQAEAQLLTEKEIFDFIFASGFSTADKISDVSGRGVGLDVVKNTIHALGGSVSVTSEVGKGTTFSIELPLTLSIISVLLVELGNQKYAIPLSSILETAMIKQKDILKAHHQKAIDFRGRILPILNLNQVFGVYNSEEQAEHALVIVRKGEKLTGFLVDRFIGQQEVVLKSLGNYLTNVFALSGATILGDGQVALIVDCNVLIK